MIQLFYSPRTRAVRPRWLLEEMGVPYQLERVNLADLPAGYLNLHPHGAVPVIRDGACVLIESGAICTYLVEKFPEKKMAPLPGSALRPAYLQWMFYCPGTFEAPFTQLFQQTRGLPEAERLPALAEKARAEFTECVHFLEHSLSKNRFLLGDDFSVVDIMLGNSLLNARRYGMLQDTPHLDRYLTELDARPARQRATQD